MLIFKCTTTLGILPKADDNKRVHLAVILTLDQIEGNSRFHDVGAELKGMNPPMWEIFLRHDRPGVYRGGMNVTPLVAVYRVRKM
jgi:hypothetical protein